MMKFVQAEPEVVETYDEPGDGWAKFAKLSAIEVNKFNKSFVLRLCSCLCLFEELLCSLGVAKRTRGY